MQEMTWLDTHIGSIEEAVEMINRFCWHLSVEEYEGKWYVLTGDGEKHVIFQADTRGAVDAFLYGMGLAYAGIPDHLLEQLERELRDWYKSL